MSFFLATCENSLIRMGGVQPMFVSIPNVEHRFKLKLIRTSGKHLFNYYYVHTSCLACMTPFSATTLALLITFKANNCPVSCLQSL